MAENGNHVHHNVGVSRLRVDGIEKVTGRAKYTGDLKFPGMLEGKILRSALPHARIRSIDISRALTVPGVVTVLTGEDLKGLKNPYYGHAVRDRPVIALDKVRFHGDPVAAVAADTEAAAEEALRLIEVEYEELPFVQTIDEALAPDAVIVNEGNFLEGNFHDTEKSKKQNDDHENICFQRHQEHGDVDKAFAASFYVREDTFTFPSVYHYALEPHTAIAVYDHSGITVWSSAQHPFIVRSELADVFEEPLHRVRVISPLIGGGFGSKSYTKIEPLVVALAKKAGRPVRISLSVEEAMHTTRRHAAVIWIKTGVDAEGHILAREIRIHIDTGAYADNGPRVANSICFRTLGAYRTPNYRLSAYCVYTNTAPAGSFRGIGAAQGTWASDVQLDMIAHHLGIDPLTLRLKNIPEKGEQFRPGNKPLDADLRSDLRLVAESIRFHERSTEDLKNSNVKRGKGLAVGLMNAGAGPVATAMIRLQADGTFLLYASSAEMGQGIRMVLTQIAAEELGVDSDRIKIQIVDTDMSPFNRSTGASRSTTVAGTAVQLAARDVKQQVFDLAVTLFGGDREQVYVDNGEIVLGDKRVTYAEVVRAFYGMPGGELIGRGYSGPNSKTKVTTSPVFWEPGIGAAEVEVDVETGWIKFLQFASVVDVGKAINPMHVEGQEHGAFMMGLGHSLFEEIVYQHGQMMNPNLVDYRVPTFTDLPDKAHSFIVENEDGPGPYGAKGVGEGGIIAIAPAMANAVYRATGVRFFDLPATPERVWRALQRHKPLPSVEHPRRDDRGTPASEANA